MARTAGPRPKTPSAQDCHPIPNALAPDLVLVVVVVVLLLLLPPLPPWLLIVIALVALEEIETEASAPLPDVVSLPPLPLASPPTPLAFVLPLLLLALAAVEEALVEELVLVLLLEPVLVAVWAALHLLPATPIVVQ